jgi:hypothetical protein
LKRYGDGGGSVRSCRRDVLCIKDHGIEAVEEVVWKGRSCKGDAGESVVEEKIV